MITVKLNRNQYDLFKDTCSLWINKLGLSSYKVIYDWRDLRLDEAMAACYTSYGTKKATIVLSTYWENVPEDANIDEYIKNTALHEVLELMLSKSRNIMDQSNLPTNVIEESTHEIIHLLQRYMSDTEK